MWGWVRRMLGAEDAAGAGWGIGGRKEGFEKYGGWVKG